MIWERNKYMVEKLSVDDSYNEENKNDKLIQLELRKINNHIPKEKFDGSKLLKFINKNFNKKDENDFGELARIWNSDLFSKNKLNFKPLKIKRKLTPFQIIENENKENRKLWEIRQNSNSFGKNDLILTSPNNNTRKKKEISIPSIQSYRTSRIKNYKLSSIKPKKINISNNIFSYSLSNTINPKCCTQRKKKIWNSNINILNILNKNKNNNLITKLNLKSFFKSNSNSKNNLNSNINLYTKSRLNSNKIKYHTLEPKKINSYTEI